MVKRKIKELLELFVGIDLHRKRWRVTVMTREVELFSGNIPGTWEALREILDRYKGHRIHAVYEANYFGFWLFDRLVHGGACRRMICLKSKIPGAGYGDAVSVCVQVVATTVSSLPAPSKHLG